MKLTLKFSELRIATNEDDTAIKEELKKFLADEFCQWDIPMAFDMGSIEIDRWFELVSIKFSTFSKDEKNG